MVDKELFDALNRRKKQQRSLMQRINKWASKFSPLADGTLSVYKVGSSIVTVEGSAVSQAAQTGVAIAEGSLSLFTVFPTMILIATSPLTFKEKIRYLAPLGLITVLGAATFTLSILALKAIGGFILATAGAALAPVVPIFLLGLTGYNLIKAFAAKKAVDTKFESQVESIEGLYQFIKTWIFHPEELSENVSTTYQSEKATEEFDILKKDLQAYVSNNHELIIHAAIKLNQGQELEDTESALLDKVQDKLNALLANQQERVHNSTDKQGLETTVPLRKQIANDTILASGVNFTLSVLGVILATTGLLLFLGVIASPPFAAAVFGGLGLALAGLGLVKFLVELKFSRDEAKYAKVKEEEKLMEYVKEALVSQPGVNPENKPAVDNKPDSNPLGALNWLPKVDPPEEWVYKNEVFEKITPDKHQDSPIHSVEKKRNIGFYKEEVKKVKPGEEQVSQNKLNS